MSEISDRLPIGLCPRPDESLDGYLVRLCDAHGYDSPQRIVETCEKAPFKPRVILATRLGTSIDERVLAHYARQPLEKIQPLFYRLFPGSGGEEGVAEEETNFFGQRIPSTYLRRLPAKVCPACLREAGYIRKPWELAVVTTCSRHGVRLVEACPDCGNGLQALRPRVGECVCGRDLTSIEPEAAGPGVLSLARRVEELCGLSSETGESVFPAGHPLGAVGLRELLDTVFFLGRHHRFDRGPVPTPERALSLRLAEMNALVEEGVQAFSEWPTRFWSLLDSKKAAAPPRHTATGLYRDFGMFPQQLSTAFPEPHCLRKSFEEYLQERWDGLITRQFGCVSKDAIENRTRVPIDQAAKELGSTPQGVRGLLEAGKLTGNSFPSRKIMVWLVDRDSLDALKQEFTEGITVRQAAEVLRIDYQRIPDLVQIGCLPPLRGPNVDGHSIWIFRRCDVESLLDRLLATVRGPTEAEEPDLVGFDEAVTVFRHMDRKAIKDVLKDILDGNIVPCAFDRQKGISGLSFPRAAVDAVRNRPRWQAPVPTHTLAATAKMAALDVAFAAHLAQTGHLKGQRATGPDPSEEAWSFLPADVQTFRKTYASGATVAQRRNMTIEELLDWAKARKISPVYECEVEGRRHHLFRKVDLGSMAYRMERAPGHNVLLTIEEVANELGKTVEETTKLADDGLIMRYSGRRRDQVDGPRFTRAEMERFKALQAEQPDLIPARTAARLLGVSVGSFYRTFSDILPSVEYRHRTGSTFYRLADVLRFAEVREGTVGPKEAAKILDITKAPLAVLRKNGKLNAVSGPDIDGFGTYLYKRTDVERLAAERNKRKK